MHVFLLRGIGLQMVLLLTRKDNICTPEYMRFTDHAWKLITLCSSSMNKTAGLLSLLIFRSLILQTAEPCKLTTGNF